jgi:hypothetical protein
MAKVRILRAGPYNFRQTMGTIWFGIKIGFGIALGLLFVYYIWREIRGLPETSLALKFHRADFNWATGPQGWISRDPSNDDWILWHESSKQMFRATDPEGDWRPSGETLEQCLALGKKYNEYLESSRYPSEKEI